MISFPKKENRREYLFISQLFIEIGIRSFDFKQELSCIGGERGR